MQRFPHRLCLLVGLCSLLGVVLLKPVAVSAAERCIMLQRQGNIETLVNVCSVCRSVTLMRSRPGNGVPVNRTLDIQAGTTFPGPFRGPGRTRIMSDRLCPSEQGGTKNLLDTMNTPPSPVKTCVSLEQNRQKGVVLVNRCSECKAVAIERWTGSSGNRVRDYVEVAPQKTRPLSSKGFSQVGLLGEVACR